MRTNINREDYVGFTYAGVHSSQFGIKSVTSGDRYQRYLSPEFQDIVTQVSGSDGTLYFGGSKTRREFNFNIAFDDMTEAEYRELRTWLNQGIQPLIFDEQPYIQYYAKLSGSAQISFIPFVDGVRRIYKGEIGLSFICYDPYGHSVHKWLNEYSTCAPSIIEWSGGSKLLPMQQYAGLSYDTYVTNGTNFLIYNPGDVSTDFIIQIGIADPDSGTTNVDSNDLGANDGVTIQLKRDSDVLSSIEFDFALLSEYNNYGDSSKSTDRVIHIDTNKRLVYFTCTQGQSQIKVPINDCIVGGDFFKIPMTTSSSDSRATYTINFDFTNSTLSSKIDDATIDYDYRYL